MYQIIKLNNLKFNNKIINSYIKKNGTTTIS